MFFETKNTIPDGFGFKIFDITHILWICAFIALCTVSVIIYKKLDTKRRNIMRIGIAVTIFLLETLKNCVAAAAGNFYIGHLPFHLCGINFLLITFSIFKRTKTVDNFLYYIGIPGAMLALLTPDWTKLPCNNFFHIHSFIIHMFLVLYPFVLVAVGEVKPDFKSMPKCIGLLIVLAIPAYFINLAFDTNFMFLMRTDDIGFLVLFENIFGNHQWAFPLLLPIVMLIMSVPILIANRIKKAKENKKALTTV